MEKMNKEQGQVSIELLVMGALILAIIAVVYLISSSTIMQAIDQQKTDVALTKLKNAVQDVYAAGEGNSRVIEIELPNRISAIEFKGNALKISLTVIGGGTTDFVALFPTNIQGIIPLIAGRQHLILETRSDGTVVIFSELILSPESITESLNKGTSKTIIMTLSNYAATAVTGNYCWVQGTDINSWTSFQGTPTGIQSTEQKDFNAIFSIPGAASIGTYTGTITCDNDQYRLVSSNVTIIVTGIDVTPPDPITGLTAVNATTCGTVNLSWNQSPAPDFNNYNIYKSLSHITDVTSLPVAKQINSVTQTTTQLTGLTDNVTNYFAVTAVDTGGNENKTTIYDANAIPTCIITVWRWALLTGSFGQSTGKVISDPDNIFDATDSNILGGEKFDVSGLSGIIRNIRMLWSHEIPMKYFDLVETTFADFNDGSFYNTTAYDSNNGRVGLAFQAGASDKWGQTTFADFNAGTKNNVVVTNKTGGEIVLNYAGGTLVTTTTETATYLTIGRAAATLYAGQSFKAIGTKISGVSLNVMKTGSPTGDITVELRTDYPTAGTVLASKALAPAAIGTSYAWVDFNFASPATVVNGTTYYIKVTTSATSSSKYYRWATNNANPYADGQAYQNEVAQASNDALLKVYFPTTYSSNGYFISTTFDATSIVDWNVLVFNAGKPTGTDVNVQLSTSNNGIDWNAFGSAYTTIGSSSIIAEENSRYLRYKVNLSTTDINASPEFRDINISFVKSAGYPSQGDYNSNSIDLNNNNTITSIDWNKTLNGQQLSLKYRLRLDANASWSNWSSGYSSSPITVNQLARYIQYNAGFQSDATQTAFLNDINIHYYNSLTNDYVKLNYGLINYNTMTAKDYNSTNSPVDKMDLNFAFIETIDVNNARPGGGYWQWTDFNNLKIGGRYYPVGSADSEWRLDAIGVEITYSP